MELALYCPVHGYYETKKDNPGRHGDFYTSVGTGELFGQLLAFQFAEWLKDQVQSPNSKVQIVEAGAHDGRLAKDILAWLLSNRPEQFGRIEYWIIEPSARRQEWQKETLKNFAPRVRWFSGFRELVGRDPVEPPQPSTPVNREQVLNPQLNGVIFGNELLDAMPVHRFGWDAAKKTWFEWGVTVEGEKYVWAKIQNPESRIQNPELDLPSSLLAVLPDGYTIETSPAAESWWRAAAGILKRGKLMTIDYGFTADELFSPSRTRGTLRSYFRHHASDDILANIGEQDLTAHVNYSAIQAAGESVGLRTEMFSTQSQFLTQIMKTASKTNSLGKWTSAQARQFQTLTHPEHLGRAFRVLVQSR
jgi:SAM-dependent MidA family methyltransferase